MNSLNPFPIIVPPTEDNGIVNLAEAGRRPSVKPGFIYLPDTGPVPQTPRLLLQYHPVLPDSRYRNPGSQSHQGIQTAS